MSLFSSWRLGHEFSPPQGESLKAFIGWNGVSIYDPEVDVVALAREYARQYQCYAEACGRCAPGRFGGKILFDLLDKIAQGKGERADIARLKEVAQLMIKTSKCEVGKTTPVPILDLLSAYEVRFLKLLKDVKNADSTCADLSDTPRVKNLNAPQSVQPSQFSLKSPQSHEIASKTPARYIAKITAPCMDACPAHVDIPAYIEGVRDRLLGDSLAQTRKSMPLAQVCSRVCPHPCEHACRRLDLDEPVSIMELKRLGADYEKECHGEYIHPRAPKAPASDKKVAIIGAGPAGLASAYYLALEGILSDVFEALPVLGGEVSVGVPEYRMPINRYNHDIEMIKSLGVRFFVNQAVDSARLRELNNSYDAIILATGARISKKLDVQGENEGLIGYEPAIPWLDRINLASKFNIGTLPNLAGKRVICVGGGFTSMDVVRCAVRLGAKRVIMLYRRDEATLVQNTSKEEYHEALEEGVEFFFQRAISEIMSEQGAIKSLLVDEYEVVYEAGAKKPSLKKIPKEPLALDCDVLIPAVSQDVDSSFIPSEWGMERTARGGFKTNGKDMSTNVPKVFAAGDCEQGPLTIVNAVGQGKRAASVVARFLQNGEIALSDEEKMEDLLKEAKVYRPDRVQGWLAGIPREQSQKEPPQKRKNNFKEVNFGLKLEDALRESERCMRCYYIAMAVV